MKTRIDNRRGTLAVLMCLLMLPLIGLVAFSVDYGFLLYVKTDLQRAADQAAIAAVRDLVPDTYGYQDVAQARQTVRDYVSNNLGQNFTVRDSDIEIGRYDPAEAYDDFTILNNGTFDTVKVTLRRDDLANSSVSLYFARVFNRASAEVNSTATAVLQKARYLGPGTAILPITVTEQTWESFPADGEFSVYGDGRVEDEFGDEVPGNWGTVDIGPSNNSSQALRDQILYGLSQNDLDVLHSQGAIPSNEYIDSQLGSMTLNADTGFSAGIKNALETQNGTTKLIPIYDFGNGNSGGSTGGGKKGNGGGNNYTYDIIGWGAVTVVSSQFSGSQNSHVTVRKSYLYNAYLIPANNLSDTADFIEGAYTSPVLVE